MISWKPIPKSRSVPGAVECMALYMAALFYTRYAGLVFGNILGPWAPMLFTVGIGVLPVLHAIFARYNLSSVFSLKRPAMREIGGGLLMWAGTFIFVLLVSGGLVLLFPKINEAGRELREKMVIGGFSKVLLSIVLLPALCEELLFRGMILTGLKNDGNKWVAVVLCGALFGFLHMDPFQIPFTVALGVVFSYVAWETRSIFVPMIMHGVHNLVILLIVRHSMGKPASAPAAMAQNVASGLSDNPLATIFFWSVLAALLAGVIAVAVILLYFGKNMVKPKGSQEAEFPVQASDVNL